MTKEKFPHTINFPEKEHEIIEKFQKREKIPAFTKALFYIINLWSEYDPEKPNKITPTTQKLLTDHSISTNNKCENCLLDILNQLAETQEKIETKYNPNLLNSKEVIKYSAKEIEALRYNLSERYKKIKED